MIKYEYPEREKWTDILSRPASYENKIQEDVAAIVADVKKNSDEAVRKYIRKYEQKCLDDIQVSQAEIDRSVFMVPERLQTAIKTAYANIEKFHLSQKFESQKIETMPGVLCWQKEVPIDSVGLYIPGGTAPLFSTVLMLGIPAQLAGCRDIILCSPAGNDGKIHPAILFCAKLCGIEKIFKTGGAQAIAAMAYGTESIPKADKIFGPGNKYVTIAKQIVSTDGVSIDMPAGPSEVAIIADNSAKPEWLAMDLLAQAEHGPDSQVLLVSWDVSILYQVKEKVQSFLATLARKETAESALSNSRSILVRNITEAIDIINFYAPEHLIINTENPDLVGDRIINAGSVFIGPLTPESVGDYASGTNHTLPTNGYAKSISGITLSSFKKTISFQKLTAQGLNQIGHIVEEMASAEGLQAHKEAVTIRLQTIMEEIDVKPE